MLFAGEDDTPQIPPRRFELTAFVGACANFVGNIARSVTALAEDVSTMCACHSAYKLECVAARDRMHLVHESLPTAPE